MLPLVLKLSVSTPLAAGSERHGARSIFPLESGTSNTWATSPANANKRSEIFLRRRPERSSLLLPGKHRTGPSLIKSEKISGEMFRQVPCDFQLRMCGSTLCLDQAVWPLGGNSCRAGSLEGKKWISDGGADCCGPLV